MGETISLKFGTRNVHLTHQLKEKGHRNSVSVSLTWLVGRIQALMSVYAKDWTRTIPCPLRQGGHRKQTSPWYVTAVHRHVTSSRPGILQACCGFKNGFAFLLSALCIQEPGFRLVPWSQNGLVERI